MQCLKRRRPWAWGKCCDSLEAAHQPICREVGGRPPPQQSLRSNIEAKSHELLVRYAPRALYVDGDPVRLAQVVANLLNNATKFTPCNGRIEISMRAKAEHVFIRVRDNGIGIAPADLDGIFEMFVQLDSSKTQPAAGLGLGLALARSLVKLHGGEITARSAGCGKGSEFRIRLPLAVPPQHRSEETNVPPPPHAPRRVLVVDDHVDAATTLGCCWSAVGIPYAHALMDRPHSRLLHGRRQRWLSSI